ncbi:MAG: hypothetical protein AAF772_06125 [Acidobacteriota bacterium]
MSGSKPWPERRTAHLAPLLLAASLTTGCISVGVRPLTPDANCAQMPTAAHHAAELDDATRQLLRRLDRDRRGAPKTLAVLDDALAAAPDGDARHALLLAGTEWSLQRACRAQRRDPDAALRAHLRAAAYAYALLTRASDVRATRRAAAVALYRRATTAVARQAQRADLEILRGNALLNVEDFDALLPADAFTVYGLRNRHRAPGLGAPLIALRENRQTRPIDRFLPPEGILAPATAMLHFDGFDRPRLALYDPRIVQTFDQGGRAWPLAHDLTAPYAYLLERAELGRLARQGLFRAKKTLDRQGIYLLEPYDPAQIPVLMVHGLVSSPLTWMELTNELFGDPALRDAYQVWHYVYPTGLPYLYSARQLKRALADLQRQLDPERDDPAMRAMVVVAHSMGGLLSKTLISHSGEQVWDAVFSVPPDALDTSDADRATLREIFAFTPQPEIDRVVFIATPHRGSRMARSWLGRLGSGLVDLPRHFRRLFTQIVRDNPASVRPSMQQLLAERGVDSIRALRPEHPLIRITGEIPVDPSVPFHTIVGDRGKGDGATGSDGVVTYRSAHLAGACSEHVVPAGHDLTGHPRTVGEVKRILRQHLAQERGCASSDR